MRADTRLPPYLPYPRFLLQADLTQTAKLLYALLLDRATLSQANGWLDEDGRIYLVFPIEKIAAALDRSPMTVKIALSELENAGLIERRRSGFSKPNHIYAALLHHGFKRAISPFGPCNRAGRPDPQAPSRSGQTTRCRSRRMRGWRTADRPARHACLTR